MAVSDLNVRVGFLFDEKALGRIERSMRNAGRRLSDLGGQMTTAISIPLGLLGAAAIKTAGDIEGLQLAMESQLGSAEAARKEIELLRKEAEKPGLGFEQAVRGSVSLQAVGFSAERARQTISQFGNALALAGKGGAELDGVVLALTQIQAKGIVSAEEINQIAERLPQIRTLMLQAFGTASTEAIQKLGITADQFIGGITEQMQNLPRATGGIKNSLENFFDALKIGAAKLGLAINNAFDVTGKLESFAAFVSAAGDGFAGLGVGMQKFIVGLGVALVAIGPVVKLIGVLQLAGAQLISLWGGMVGAAKVLQVWLLNVANAFRALNLATQAFVLIGVAVAIFQIVSALGLFNRELSATQRAQESVNQLIRDSAAAVQEEKTRVTELAKVVKDQNATYAERKNAIQQLQAISPEYFGSLKAEKTNYEQLDAAVGKYVQSLVDAETVRQAVSRKAQIAIEKQNVGLNTTTSLWQDVKAGVLGFGNAADASAIAAGYLSANIATTNENLSAEDKALDALIAKHGGVLKANLGSSSSTQNFGASIKTSTGAVKEQVNALDAYLDKLHEQVRVQNQLREVLASMGLAPLETLPKVGSGAAPFGQVPKDFVPLDSQTTLTEADVDAGVGSRLLPISTLGTDLVAALTPAQALLEALNTGVLTFNESFALMAEGVAENGTLMEKAVTAAAEAMEAAAASGASSFKELGAAALQAAAKVVRAKIMEAVSGYIASALVKFGIFGLAIAAGGGAIVGGLFNMALKAIKVPGYAKGTDFAPGGLSLVGEKGPELVNLPRGSQVTPNASLSNMLFGGGDDMTLSHRISGSDLLFVVERAQRNAKRTRGF